MIIIVLEIFLSNLCMAVFFSRPSTTVLLLLLFFFFFFLITTTTRICSASSCPLQPSSCDPSIYIGYPFYKAGDYNVPAGCKGIYLIRCNINASKAMIQFEGYLLTVKDIDYHEKTITVEDEQFTSTAHPNLACSFLYNFTHPPILHSFDDGRPNYSSAIIDSIAPISYDCKWGEDTFANLSSRYNYSVCRDFSFYYRTSESEKDHQGVSPTCRADKPPLFELKLSFGSAVLADGEGMSLLSAGFSAYALKLRSDCFNANVLCSSNNKDSEHAVKKTAIVADIVGGTVALVTACCIVIYCYYRIYKKKSSNNDQNVENFLKEHGSLAPKRYKYSDVKKITESFRNKLGQGGYGSVFKGTLIDGRLVAVKVLSDSKGNGEDFFNEIASIGRSSHVNIVNLLGFCSEGSKRALIYEYMCNGSLDKLISSDEPKTTLRWKKLYHIAIGIARGLEYLHRGCNTRIVHFDIKPHNILLDEDFRPKISDFGLSKSCLRKDSILSMEGTRGTVGYIAPEVFCRNFGVVSSKSDIYSYGMMVLEMVGGRENIPLDVQDSSQDYFPFSIYKHLDYNGGLQAYGATAETEEVVRKMILVGLWCIQTVPQNRPSITKVIEMLEGSIDYLQVPPKPNLSFPSFGPIMDISSCSNDVCSSAVR